MEVGVRWPPARGSRMEFSLEVAVRRVRQLVVKLSTEAQDKKTQKTEKNFVLVALCCRLCELVI